MVGHVAFVQAKEAEAKVATLTSESLMMIGEGSASVQITTSDQLSCMRFQ